MTSENTRPHNASRLAPPDPSILTEPVRCLLEEETRRFGAPLNMRTG
jgi:hypothetical protein